MRVLGRVILEQPQAEEQAGEWAEWAEWVEWAERASGRVGEWASGRVGARRHGGEESPHAYVYCDEKRRGRKKGARFEEAGLRGMGDIDTHRQPSAVWWRTCT